MSSRKPHTSLQDCQSHRRNSDLCEDPASQPGLLASSLKTPEFQSGAYPSSGWPFNSSPIPALNSDLQSSAYPTLLNPQDSTTSLHSASSLPDSFYNHHFPYPEYSHSAPCSEQSVDLSSSSVDCKEQLSIEQHPSGVAIISYPMSVASDAYFAGQMQPNSHHYVWPNRPYQQIQPQSGHMSQQYPPPSYPSSGFPVGYGGQPGGPIPGYHTESTPSYMSGAPGSARQPNSRSPSMTRSFPPQTAGLPEQPLMTTSSPYMMNQPAYYLPEAPPIPSSHHSSMSSPASSMVPDPVFQTDSVPTSDEHPVRVLSSRPRPQCWDHGCNGREFSTFSNLLRHQREKSGVVAKAECPICGAVFTRTTARNIHVAQGKCKGAGREASAE